MFLAGLLMALSAEAQSVKLIFDTDMGNDVDDALALAMIHTLQNRGECELLAVTITKDHEEVAPYVDAINSLTSQLSWLYHAWIAGRYEDVRGYPEATRISGEGYTSRMASWALGRPCRVRAEDVQPDAFTFRFHVDG